MDLSIIIVNYNTKYLTKQTIDSVLNTVESLDYELWVVDNASNDGSQAYLDNAFDQPFIHFIWNKQNVGFSKANNQALKKSSGDYVLLLNSDTLVHPNAIEKSLSYLKSQPSIGALGCKLLLGNGKLDHTCKRGFPTPEASFYYFMKLDKLFPHNKKFGTYRLTYLPENEINEVDALVGAYMLLPREVILSVGLLDEHFFMYGEDIDWCYRIKAAGYKIIYYPEATITHLKGQSSKKKRTKTIYEFHRAMLLFYNKHYKHQYPYVVTLLTYLGISLKCGISYLVNVFKK